MVETEAADKLDRSNTLTGAVAVNPRRWGVVHFLAALSVPLLFWQAWSWVAWLQAGPGPLTEYRDTSHYSWVLARIFETASVFTLIVVVVMLVRQCRREGRIVFDVLFCIAGSLTYWLDPVCNFYQPLFLWSQNWVNLNDWVGTMPLAQLPSTAETPHAVVFAWPLYTAGFLVFAKLLCGIMRAGHERWPRLRPLHLVAIAMVGGALIDIALETPMYLSRLWAFPGTPDWGFFSSGGRKFPLNEFVAGGYVFGALASLRYFKDSQGKTVLERGLERHSPRRRTIFTSLALIAVFNGLWLANNVQYMIVGTYSAEYKEMDAFIIQGVCDVPGTRDDAAASGTAYGPCPGSPGYEIPLRQTMTPSETP